MTLTRPSPIPPSGYDPRFRELLIRGARERIEVVCEDAAQAAKLRKNLNSFRARCRSDQTADWEHLYRAVLSVGKDAPHVLIVRPRGDEFSSALAPLGLEVPEPPEATAAAPLTSPEASPDPFQLLDDALPPLPEEGEKP